MKYACAICEALCEQSELVAHPKGGAMICRKCAAVVKPGAEWETGFTDPRPAFGPEDRRTRILPFAEWAATADKVKDVGAITGLLLCIVGAFGMIGALVLLLEAAGRTAGGALPEAVTSKIVLGVVGLLMSAVWFALGLLIRVASRAMGALVEIGAAAVTRE